MHKFFLITFSRYVDNYRYRYLKKNFLDNIDISPLFQKSYRYMEKNLSIYRNRFTPLLLAQVETRKQVNVPNIY